MPDITDRSPLPPADIRTGLRPLQPDAGTRRLALWIAVETDPSPDDTWVDVADFDGLPYAVFQAYDSLYQMEALSYYDGVYGTLCAFRSSDTFRAAMSCRRIVPA